jgi:hypothetical protein
MIQDAANFASSAAGNLMLRLIRSVGFWFLLAGLLAFVVFVECLAYVGGSHKPLGVPTPSPAPAETRLVPRPLVSEFEHELGVVVPH